MKNLLVAVVLVSAGTLSTSAFAQAANVIDFGADPTGSTDSTLAFSSAAAASNSVFAPCGTFLVNWTVASKNNFRFSGSGTCTFLQPYAGGGDVIRITGGNFSEFRDFSLVNRSGFSANNGVTIASGQGNTKIINIFVSGFATNGINVVGTSSNQLSGIDIVGGIILNNGNAGISYVYSNDFHISDTSIGQNTGYGIYMNNSSAGQTVGNFVWENGTGIYASSSNFNWWTRNRLTQSKLQGFVCSSCTSATITDNQSYQNSNAVPFSAEDWKLVGVNGVIFTGNNALDWTGAPHTNYGLTIDGTSKNVTVQNNQFSLHQISSANISASASAVQYRNNLPLEDVSVNNCGSGSFVSGNSAATAVGGVGATVFLGGSQGPNENQTTFPIAAPANVCAFSVFVGSVPGAGQAHTFTLRKNGVSTGITGSISGGAGFAANVISPANAISVARGDALDLMMVSSSGAAPTTVRYAITIAQQ